MRRALRTLALLVAPGVLSAQSSLDSLRGVDQATAQATSAAVAGALTAASCVT